MPEPTYDLLREIGLAAERQQVDPALVVAMVEVESGFDPAAVGDGGMSYGLMQLHLEGAGAGYTPEWLLDVSNNLELGTAFLRACVDRFPSLNYAVSAYNQGIAGAEQRGIINQGYVNQVLQGQKRWSQRMREVLTLAHIDAVYGHLEQGMAELLKAKHAAGLS